MLRYAAAVLAALTALAGHAQEQPLKVSGFLSVIGGQAFGTHSERYQGPGVIAGNVCPCYVADWSNAALYTDDPSLSTESRAGIQLKYTVSPQLAAVAQVVLRGSDPHPRLQWAYVSYAPSRELEFQAGRKRIPLYFYSDFQDIGTAYPWISVPPELYGWEATNYNGASMSYKADHAGTAVRLSVFAGRESIRNALYQKLYYEGRTRVRWDSLRGAELEISRGPLTARAVYMQTDERSTNPAAGLDEASRIEAYGLAANVDVGSWFMLSEVTQLTRRFDAGHRATAPAVTVGAGYRLGSWTPFLNFARYKDGTDAPEIYIPQSFQRASLTLRYDIDLQSSIKGQLDLHRDLTRNFGGDVTVLRLAYDRLF